MIDWIFKELCFILLDLAFQLQSQLVLSGHVSQDGGHAKLS